MPRMRKLCDSTGLERMARTTEPPWFPVAPNTVINFDIAMIGKIAMGEYGVKIILDLQHWNPTTDAVNKHYSMERLHLNCNISSYI
jgi:hypothetical protein